VIRGELARIDLDAIGKVPMRALSAGPRSSTNASAAFSTSSNAPSMLPLRSSITTAVIGCVSLLKIESVCRVPLSST